MLESCNSTAKDMWEPAVGDNAQTVINVHFVYLV